MNIQDAVNNMKNIKTKRAARMSPIVAAPMQNGLSSFMNTMIKKRDLNTAIQKDKADAARFQSEMSNMSGLGGSANNIINTSTGSDSNKGFLDKLAYQESKGNYNAYNKGSKAFGKYQFIPSTEKDVAGRLGISIKEARTPAGQERMVNYLTNQNRRGLEKAGYEANDTNLWYAHNLGLGGAKTLLGGGKVNPLHITSNQAKNQQDYINKWSGIFGEQSTYGNKKEQAGLSQNEMNELDDVLGEYAYNG